MVILELSPEESGITAITEPWILRAEPEPYRQCDVCWINRALFWYGWIQINNIGPNRCYSCAIFLISSASWSSDVKTKILTAIKKYLSENPDLCLE